MGADDCGIPGKVHQHPGAHGMILTELREHIKYELRRGNITAEKAATLTVLIDEINPEGNVAKAECIR